MPRRSPESSPFLLYVFLPGLRSTLLAFAVLAIGFGSWLETTDSVDNCAFRSNLALQKVSLLRNLSSDTLSPDIVTFGLWKHCFIYALNCTCAPARLTYEPEFSTILEAAIGNHTAIPLSDDQTSLWRVVPLAIGTAFAGVAFIYGLVIHRLVYCNKNKNDTETTTTRKQLILQWSNAGIILVTTILVAIGFGYSYQQYSSGIRSACDQLDNSYCTAVHSGVEFTVLIVGIVLAGLSLLLWAYVPRPHNQQQQQQRTSGYYNASSSSIQKGGGGGGYDSSYVGDNHRRNTPTLDVLEPWRDVALFDDKVRTVTNNNNNNNAYRPIEDHALDDYDGNGGVVGGPLPPPPSNRRRSTQTHYHHHPPPPQNNHHPYYQGREDLQPPSRPYVSSPRRASHGSGNTFGANNMLRHSRGSSMMMEENDYYYSSGADSDGNHSPTRPSSRRRSSSAMSPHPHSPRRRSQSPYSRPGTAPLPTTTTNSSGSPTQHHHHPLNQKVITDQRISAYLQQQR
ncbi:hypothetical protein BDB00DRAFT_849557 [Zychaea mexicana]|uniref:uncharacterized protein n=1 Tax=Zychaea mexicana TaxID=64656 RepID=UPI0022FF2639|nr:uncharacterized protein BDB00DRAFT_849557 [Zychaea mexicana]KAI9488165.1 hypothetical protein BDB00DRAFT_849557 [Zychaea mexicana]